MKTKIVLLVSLVMALFMTTCGGDNPGGWSDALLTIKFIGNAGSELDCKVDISGPTPLNLEAKSGDSIQTKVAVGNYNITVKALLGATEYADGNEEIKVIAGNNYISISLNRIGGVATPQANLTEGTYTEPQIIILETDTVGATIYYTLDGSDPSTSPTRKEYTGPFILDTAGTTTLRVIAVNDKGELLDSLVFEADYTINPDGVSSAKAITAFSFPAIPSAVININERAKTINVTAPYGTNVTSLTPTITHTGVSYSPTGAQNFSTPKTYTVTAEDGGTQNYTVTVNIATVAPNITTVSLPNGVEGEAGYSQTLTASGTAPITWTLDNGALPTGLSLATNGTISGTPTVSGTFNFTVKAANIAGSNTKALAIVIVPATPYIITGSGAAFTATKNGSTIGTPNQPIQTVIDAIKTNAAGNDCEIQFGNGAVVLDIGTDYIDFDGTGSPGWGKITLLGKITSENATYDQGTISLQNGVSIDIKGEIENAGAYGRAVYNNSSGVLNIFDGTVSATGCAVYNNSSGTVNISGGEVSTTGASAVYNASNGEVKISGGTVSANMTPSGVAVGSTGAGGKITVSGTAMVISAGANSFSTIQLYGGTLVSTLEISGGTVLNTLDAGGIAVFSLNVISGSLITISGGIVSATGTSSYAVYSDGSDGDVVNILGGTVSATGTGSYAVRSIYGTVTIYRNDATIIPAPPGGVYTSGGTTIYVPPF